MEMVAAFRTTSPNSGQSPAELLFGQKIRTVADIRNEKILQRKRELSGPDQRRWLCNPFQKATDLCPEAGEGPEVKD